MISQGASRAANSLTSTADTKLAKNASTTNYGGATTLGADGDDPGGSGRDAYSTLRWDLSSIPAGSKVSSVSITLNVTNGSTQTYQLYELKRPWVESTATWLLYASGSPWEVAGAKGSLDRGAQVGSVPAPKAGKQNFTLSASVVQGWIENPSSNQGIIIANATNTNGFDFSSREVADASLRPTLSVTYTTSGAPDTTPPDTTIDSGPSATAASTSSSASFTFSSSESNSAFECRLDDAAYYDCTSPKSYSGLDDGSHTFYVRAIDGAGNVDPTPANQTWMIDTTTVPPPPNSKLIALTFDDGPDPANTPKILDILQLHNVKATFFVIGQRVNSYPHLVGREYQEGHMVGNHSYTHPDLTELSSAGVEKELRDTNTVITSAGVPQPKLFRPPYGYTNAQVASIGGSLGMTQTLWDQSQSIEDWRNPPPAEICDRTLRDTKPGAIVVLHDGGTTNTDDALECIITRLKEQGYGFGLVYPSSTYNSLNSSYVEIR